MGDQVYRARKPKTSPLWQCLARHFDAFQDTYEERYQPRRIPSAQVARADQPARNATRIALQAGKVWEADPLICPRCQKEMRIVSLIDDRQVITRILRHLGLWEQGVRVSPARACPEPRPKGSGSRAPPEIVDRVIPPSPVGYGGQAEPWLDVEDPPGQNPFPDYDTEPVMAYAND